MANEEDVKSTSTSGTQSGDGQKPVGTAKKDLPYFTGGIGTNARVWLNNAEAIQLMNKWDDAQLLANATVAMTVKAAMWWSVQVD